MIRIDIKPVWTFRLGEERQFDFRMVPLLEGIERSGKLTRAAEDAGISYRHAWNLIEQWSKFLGAPLVHMERGKGTSLTELGANLLWAGKRAQARLEPELASLASEFAAALNQSLYAPGTLLTVHASHDLALARAAHLAHDAGLTVEMQYRGSFDALAALARGECDLAGFHLPLERFGRLMARRYAECLPPEDFACLGFVTRRQGFIVRAGNPRGIRSVHDLARPDVRMINRQRGSGTRALLEFMLSTVALDRARIRGYEIEESTHSAVAALIAGSQADVGLGVEAAAREYRLDFVPLCEESYFLACRRDKLSHPAVTTFRDLISSALFARELTELAGYRLDRPGEEIAFGAALALAEASPS